MDCEASTIKTFHDILYKNVVDFNQVELDLDFLMFIHKYDIKAMYSATQRYGIFKHLSTAFRLNVSFFLSFCRHILAKLKSRDFDPVMLIETIKVADMISDKEMFDIAMVIVDLRIEYIEVLPEWIKFQGDCPHLAQKVKNAVEAMKSKNQEN